MKNGAKKPVNCMYLVDFATSLSNQMIFIVLQCKKCFLQIPDRGMIFKSKVYWIKWFSSSCSSKGVSFKFQIDAWYSNPKSTEWNDFHRLTVQKVFLSNFRQMHDIQNQSLLNQMIFIVLQGKRCFLQIFR